MFGTPIPSTIREHQIHRDGYRYGFVRGYYCGREQTTAVDSVAKATGYTVLAVAAGFLGMKFLAPAVDTIVNR